MRSDARDFPLLCQPVRVNTGRAATLFSRSASARITWVHSGLMRSATRGAMSRADEAPPDKPVDPTSLVHPNLRAHARSGSEPLVGYF